MTCYTPAELAARWKCSASFVRRLIDNGELPAFRIGNKLLRVTAEAVEGYERSQRTNARIDLVDGPSRESADGGGSAVAKLDAAVRRERRR